MFGNKKESIKPANSNNPPAKTFRSTTIEPKAVQTGTINTLVSESCKIQGSVYSEHSIKIDGEIIGDITAKGTVIIAKKGTVTGEINADVLIVYGKLNGNSLTKSIHIQEDGCIEGNIETLSLQVEPSATYIGSVSMSGKSTPANQNKENLNMASTEQNKAAPDKTNVEILSHNKTG